MLNKGALSGIRVLDMTRVVAGPYAGQILGDLGAEVVKIERKGEGDDCRRVGPPWMDNELGRQGQDSTYYQSVNRNKSSISVDFATEAGADLIRQLAANADVLVENYRSGTLARYGLGYEELKAINPKLIYCSVTGFGQTGPYAGRSGVPIADICARLYAAISVLAALNYRNVSGEGQYIDVSLFDSQLSAMLNTFSGWFNGGTALGRTGNDHPSAAPYGVFPVDDGFILIATFNDREFVRLSAVLGHAEWATDTRFCSMGARVANREELKALVTEALKGKTKAEWVEILNAGTVSCGGINEMADLEKDPQVLARELIVSQEHPTNGTIRSAASPMRFSASPVTYRQAPPLLGEHNEQILSSWLGFDEAQIKALQAQGAI